MRRMGLLVLLLGLGCGGDETNNAADTGTPDSGTPTADMAPDAGDSDDASTQPDMASVDASADMAEQVDSGGVEGPPDRTARLIYTNQRVFREDKFFARGGIAVVELITPQELPPDDRPEFLNDDGERCTFESGTEWPQVPPSGGTWPAGPFVDGGDVSLTVDGAPGPVVYGYLDTYYVRESPGPVVLENITYSSFFPPEYIPHGESARLSTAGGPAVGAFETDVDLAADYTVSAPDLETGNDVIDTESELQFTWSPASPGDTMAVIVKDSFGFVKCRFDDDGSATVPAGAMAQLIGGQFVRLTVQTWREHTVERLVRAADDQVIDVQFTSRHVQIGRFDSM